MIGLMMKTKFFVVSSKFIATHKNKKAMKVYQFNVTSLKNNDKSD